MCPSGFLPLVLFILLWTPHSTCVGEHRIAREPGNRDGTFFYHIEDGFHYHISEVRDDVTYFKCVHYGTGCRGRATYNPDDGFQHSEVPHTCGRDHHYPAERELRRNILARCTNLEYVSFSRIIDEESRGYHMEVRARITEARMRTAMRTARMANYPDLPQSLRALSRILMNPRYEVITMTQDGNDNLYAGSVTDAVGGHHVVFVSQRILDCMRTLRVLHFDGTFKTVPAGLDISQVFCIVGVWRNHIIPLVWALMESRTIDAYTAVLSFLRDELLGDDIEFNRAIMDFEPGEMSAVSRVFNVRVQGCLWHLARLFMRYATDRGLIRPMRRIEAVGRIVRLTFALPLLPEHLIRAGMVEITREALEEGNYIFAMVRPYLMDIYRLWIRSERKRTRMCVFGSTQRTNNACEAQNRMLREAVGIHPNIYAFIAGILRMEDRAVLDIHRLQNGLRVGRARARSSILSDQRVARLQQDLLDLPRPNNRAIMAFLRGGRHVMENLINEAMM